MIDYVPMEIVAYADEPDYSSLPFTEEELFPSELTLKNYRLGQFHTTINGYEVTYLVRHGGYAVRSDAPILQTQPQILGQDVTCLLLYSYTGVVLGETSGFYAYYGSTNLDYSSNAVSASGCPMYKLTPADYLTEGGSENPLPDYDISGRGVEWLYGLGEFLAAHSEEFSDLLSIKIGDFNLIGFFIGAGFAVYMGWCIVKWIII